MEVLCKNSDGYQVSAHLRWGTEHHGYLGPPPPRETWHTIIYRPDAFFQNQFGKHLYLLALNEMKIP